MKGKKNKKEFVLETEWNGNIIDNGVIVSGPYKGWSLGLAYFYNYCLTNDAVLHHNNDMEE